MGKQSTISAAIIFAASATTLLANAGGLYEGEEVLPNGFMDQQAILGDLGQNLASADPINPADSLVNNLNPVDNVNSPNSAESASNADSYADLDTSNNIDSIDNMDPANDVVDNIDDIPETKTTNEVADPSPDTGLDGDPAKDATDIADNPMDSDAMGNTASPLTSLGPVSAGNTGSGSASSSAGNSPLSVSVDNNIPANDPMSMTGGGAAPNAGLGTFDSGNNGNGDAVVSGDNSPVDMGMNNGGMSTGGMSMGGGSISSSDAGVPSAGTNAGLGTYGAGNNGDGDAIASGDNSPIDMGFESGGSIDVAPITTLGQLGAVIPPTDGSGGEVDIQISGDSAITNISLFDDVPDIPTGGPKGGAPTATAPPASGGNGIFMDIDSFPVDDLVVEVVGDDIAATTQDWFETLEPGTDPAVGVGIALGTAVVIAVGVDNMGNDPIDTVVNDPCVPDPKDPHSCNHP